MNRSIITQLAMMALTLFPPLQHSIVIAQETASDRSVFEELEALQIAFQGGAEQLTLSAAVNPFGDLQFSLLAVSHDRFDELEKLLSEETPESLGAKAATSTSNNYQLAKTVVKKLDRRLKSMVKTSDAKLFHSYRIARKDADFLFGELPAGGGQVDSSKFAAALTFETDRTRNGIRELTGKIRFKDVAEEPVDVAFTLSADRGDESPIGHMVAIPTKDRTWLLTLGQLQSKRNASKASVSTETKATQPRPSTSEQAAIAALQLDVDFFEAKFSDLEVVAKLVDQPIQSEDNVFVVQLNAEQVGTLSKLNMELESWNQLPKKKREDNKSIWRFRPRRKSGQDRWNVIPDTATVQIEPSPDSGKLSLVTVEVSGGQTPKSQHSAHLANDTRAAFVAIPKDKETFAVAAIQYGYESETPFATAAGAISPATALSSPPSANEQKLIYRSKGSIFELHEEALMELRAALSMDELTEASCVVSRSDLEPLQDFVDKKLKNGQSKVLSTPMVTVVSGAPAQLLIGSEVPVLVHGDLESNVEFENVGLLLDTVLSPADADSNNLDWTFANTNQEGGGFVERRTRGRSVLADGESILIFLPPQGRDGRSVVACLTPSRVEQTEVSTTPKVHTSPQSKERSVAKLVEEFNLAMKERRFNDAAEIAERARKIRQDSTTLALVEMAKLTQRVVESIKSEPAPGVVDSALATSGIDIVPSQGSQTEIQLANASELSGVEGRSLVIACDDRIAQVDGFDHEVVNVRPIQGRPSAIEVLLLSEGATVISVVDEDNQRHQIKVLVKADDGGLSLYLGKLYPTLKIGVWPFKGAVLLRGKVPSSTQKRQIMTLAECFFPTVLDQITIDSSLPNLPLPRELATETQIDRERITINGDKSAPLFLVKNQTNTLLLPNAIRSVTGFDSECVKVQPALGESSAVQLTAINGSTEMTFKCSDNSVHKVTIVVQEDVSHLTYLAHELYPHLKLNFIPVHGAVVVRGSVIDKSQINEIIELAEQYYPAVLNHLEILSDATVGSENADSSRPASIRTVSLPSTGGQIEAVRSDIKALHSDVRDLIDILRSRHTK